MEISERLNPLVVSPFFRNVRETGLLIRGVGDTSVALHFAFSEILGSPEGYLPVAGRVLASVSQTTASGAEAQE